MQVDFFQQIKINELSEISPNPTLSAIHYFKEVQKSPRSLERRGLFAFWSVSTLKKVKREAATQRRAQGGKG